MAGPGQNNPLEYAACGVEGVREVRGALDAGGLSFGIGVGRFHTGLTRPLLHSVLEVLLERGAAPEAVTVVWVPGSFEVPSALEALAGQGGYQALLALGAVIEGETSHADAIVSSVTAALRALACRSGLPVIDGIVAAPSYEIAEARCVPGPDSRGGYLAESAIEMARVMAQLRGEPG